MKTIGNFEFPETPEEAKQWVHAVVKIALHMKVLCVAHTRIEGKWCAYCKPVFGINHEKEADSVFHFGQKLPEKIALAIFPCFKGIPYAR